MHVPRYPRGLASLLFGLWQKTTLLLMRGLRRADVLFRAYPFPFLFVLRDLLYQSLLSAPVHERDYTEEIAVEVKTGPSSNV